MTGIGKKPKKKFQRLDYNCIWNECLKILKILKKKSIKKNYNNSFLKSIVSFKSGPVEMMVTGTPVSV